MSLIYLTYKFIKFILFLTFLLCKNFKLKFNVSSHSYIYVTGPAKIGHICTQNLALFLNFNSQYLMKYKSYDNEILKAYSQMNKKAEKLYRT